MNKGSFVSLQSLSANDLVSLLQDVHKLVVSLGVIEANAFTKDRLVTKQSVSEKPLAQMIVATAFFEPSTRTRISFEIAIRRLGGDVVAISDMNASTTKGETIEDTVAILSGYVDAIVIRHPEKGLAQRVVASSSVPIINAGDGSGEHPTQAIIDLYTMWFLRFRPANAETVTIEHFQNRLICLWGDLLNGRTIHSLIPALKNLGVRIRSNPAKGLDVPPEYASDIFSLNENEAVDVLYVTRLQKERLNSDLEIGYESISKTWLDQRPGFKNALILHPLPRVGELSNELDLDERAGYFQQAAFAIPVRMAIFCWVLGKDI